MVKGMVWPSLYVAGNRAWRFGRRGAAATAADLERRHLHNATGSAAMPAEHAPGCRQHPLRSTNTRPSSSTQAACLAALQLHAARAVGGDHLERRRGGCLLLLLAAGGQHGPRGCCDAVGAGGQALGGRKGLGRLEGGGQQQCRQHGRHSAAPLPTPCHLGGLHSAMRHPRGLQGRPGRGPSGERGLGPAPRPHRPPTNSPNLPARRCAAWTAARTGRGPSR